MACSRAPPDREALLLESAKLGCHQRILDRMCTEGADFQLAGCQALLRLVRIPAVVEIIAGQPDVAGKLGEIARQGIVQERTTPGMQVIGTAITVVKRVLEFWERHQATQHAPARPDGASASFQRCRDLLQATPAYAELLARQQKAKAPAAKANASAPVAAAAPKSEAARPVPGRKIRTFRRTTPKTKARQGLAAAARTLEGHGEAVDVAAVAGGGQATRSSAAVEAAPAAEKKKKDDEKMAQMMGEVRPRKLPPKKNNTRNKKRVPPLSDV
jgi:hypothetical protein